MLPGYLGQSVYGTSHFIFIIFKNKSPLQVHTYAELTEMYVCIVSMLFNGLFFPLMRDHLSDHPSTAAFTFKRPSARCGP